MRRLAPATSAIALALGLSAPLAPHPAALAAPARAEDAIPETIVTATRIPTPAERVPAAVTVLTRADIEERGYQTLAEALRAIPGVRLVQSGGPGQVASAFIRGANAEHTLVLLDGVPAGDPSAPNGAFDFGQDILALVDRVEVVRGPASSLYGSGAIGGVVNIVTRRAGAGQPFAPFGEAAAGTQGTFRGSLGAAGESGAVDWLLGAGGLTTRGFDATPRRLAADSRERDGAHSASGVARIGVRLDAGTRVEALLRWRETVAEFDNVPRDDPNTRASDRRWFGQLRGETALLDGAWTTGLRAAVTQDRRIYLNRPDQLSPAASRDTYSGERTTLEWTNRLRLGDLGPLREAALAFGASYAFESVRSGFGTGAFRTLTDAEAGAAALQAGLQGRVGERLDLSAGLRHDEAEDYAGRTTWRAGAVLALPEVSGRLRASAGTAFRAPTLYQRFGRSAFFQGNPGLQPETSFGWEVGAEADVALAGRADALTVSATWFESRIDDLITFNRGFSTLENVARARIEGAELAATVRPAAWLSARAAWTITDARNADTDQRLARRPRNAWVFDARIAPLPRLVVVPEVLVTGSQVDFVYPSAGQPGFGAVGPSPGGTVVNLTVTYAATGGVQLFAEGRNLGDTRWEPANGFVTPGRSVLVGTRFGF